MTDPTGTMSAALLMVERMEIRPFRDKPSGRPRFCEFFPLYTWATTTMATKERIETTEQRISGSHQRTADIAELASNLGGFLGEVSLRGRGFSVVVESCLLVVFMRCSTAGSALVGVSDSALLAVDLSIWDTHNTNPPYRFLCCEGDRNIAKPTRKPGGNKKEQAVD